MENYGPSTYGDRIADLYDELYQVALDPSEAIEMLAELAGPGPVLELGIGTGRLALPLAERGLEVHGIDASERMVAKLRAKPGGENIPVVIGDFVDVPVEGTYSLVFVAFNTLFGLTAQEEQVRCFRNVAAHLAPEGRFLIDVWVPDPGRFDRNQRVGVSKVDAHEVHLEVSRYDPVTQVGTTQMVVMSETGTSLYPVVVRSAWPSELDLMAQLAGLSLQVRWEGWGREPFTASSRGHISVYGSELDLRPG